MVDSLSWDQPSLFGRPMAIKLVFEVLVDHDDESAVISYRVSSWPGGTLVALASSPPVPLPDFEARVREFTAEFTRMIREHTGPF